MIIGLIKWYDNIKGFGLIGTPDNGDFFIHGNNFIDKPLSIDKGAAVVFNKKDDFSRNRSKAINCRLIGDLRDWKLILNYLDKPDDIAIEVETQKQFGTKIIGFHRGIRIHSLKDLAAKQFFLEKKENELLKTIIYYFENHLNKKKFITYCEFVENKIIKYIRGEKAQSLLNEIFTHFGNNLNDEILFHTWKHNKFKFIGYMEDKEYEIPEGVLKTFSKEIGFPELKRIINFEHGSKYCDEIIKLKFRDLNNLTANEIINMYPVLDLMNKKDKKNHKSKLDRHYFEKIVGVLNNTPVIFNINKCKSKT